MCGEQGIESPSETNKNWNNNKSQKEQAPPTYTGEVIVVRVRVKCVCCYMYLVEYLHLCVEVCVQYRCVAMCGGKKQVRQRK